MNRNLALQQLARGEIWDVAIIGGGATGLGLAVDAASRGYRTILLEAADFCHGTSSRSTKLVHGGVRYLEQGDIPLVLEALRERGRLHQNAPHLVRHLSFIVPRYQWWEGPFFGLGLKLYDALAGKLNLAPSRLVSREETLARIPNIEPQHLLGGVEYFDGQFDDARLGLTLARTAFQHGATLLNYFRVTRLIKSRGPHPMIEGLEATDRETGQSHSLRARVVLNATGVFSDTIRRLDDVSAPSCVQPSQGVHLVLPRSFLAGDSAIMVPHTDDGRVLFVIPWHDKVLVGTTDIARDTPDQEPQATDEEIEFILRNAARYLAVPPTRADVLSVFAGQRPLVRPPTRDGQATKKISRNHEILISDAGLLTLVGGKWTTYRKMAEDALERAIVLGNLPEVPCRTADLPLHGATTSLPADTPDWKKVYGSARHELEKWLALDPSWGEPLHPALPYPRATVAQAVEHEMARTVEDVLSRRTRALLLDARAAEQAAPLTARLLAELLKRSDAWAREQVKSFQGLARQYRPSSV
jgi:glycerol-3-phosphate dehydrogenase